MFLTTQYLTEADELADRVAIIEKGRIVTQGTPRELKERVGHRSIVVRPSPAEAAAAITVLSGFGETQTAPDGAVRCQLRHDEIDLAGIVRALDGAGVGVTSWDIHAPTLDDVFFAETGRELRSEGEPQ